MILPIIGLIVVVVVVFLGGMFLGAWNTTKYQHNQYKDAIKKGHITENFNRSEFHYKDVE
jgi:uncharacterized protein YneF (UPF0154 family)